MHIQISRQSPRWTDKVALARQHWGKQTATTVYKVWLSETSHGTMPLCMHAHMACISPWPCPHAVVRLLNARHSNLIKKYPCFFFALGSGCALTTEISTANLVGLGIYGEANSVTDVTTVLLYHITSTTSSQGRTRPIPGALKYSLSCHLLEWWSVWWYAPLTRQDDCIPGFGHRCDHPAQALRIGAGSCPGMERVTRARRDGLTYHSAV